MTRPKLSTPPIRGIDMEKFVEMAMKISTETAGGRRGLRAVLPVMDGMVAYASEAMLPSLGRLALLARDRPHSIKQAPDGWRIAHAAGDDPREITCLLTQDGLSGGWLMRARFRTSLTASGRAERARQMRENAAGGDLAAEVVGAMKVDGQIDRDPTCHAMALEGDAIREILISAIDLSAPLAATPDNTQLTTPCEATSGAAANTPVLRLRPQAFTADGVPCVSASDSGQHEGLAPLRVLSGLIMANRLESSARDRHTALAGLGWKQFGDAGNACLLGVGMAMIGASEGLLDEAAVARLGRFTRDILTIELRRVMPVLPELFQFFVSQGHVTPDNAWSASGGRVQLWLDRSSRSIACHADGVRHDLPLDLHRNGDCVLTDGAVELARVRLSDGPVPETDHVGGSALPPPVRVLTDILLSVQKAHHALRERNAAPQERQASPAYP